MFPESNATDANFTRSEQYTVESLVGANLDVMETVHVDFLTVCYLDGKVTCIVQKQQSVFRTDF